MPLPDSHLIVNGGCNCGAVRYKIEIPGIKERPLHPLADAVSGPVCLPFAYSDHCNDCRRATGALLPHWICTPIKMVSTSLVLRSSAHLHPEASERKAGEAELRGPWLSAADVFEPPGPASVDSFLTFYQSSEGCRRSFCGRCGTMLAYTIFPMPEGWLDTLDIALGTVDRQDLEQGMLWRRKGSFGIVWAFPGYKG